MKQMVLVNSLRHTVDASLGDFVSVECKSTVATDVFWATGQDKTIRNTKSCKGCNIRSDSWTSSSGEFFSLLKMTPYHDADFGWYKCKGITADGVVTLDSVLVKENITLGPTLCLKQYRRARLLKEKAPFCDEDGSFRRVQMNIVEEKRFYWCVDPDTGIEIGEKESDVYALDCTPVKISLGISLGILLGVQALILIIDVIMFFTCKEGIIAHISKYRKKSKGYQPLKRRNAKKVHSAVDE